MQKINIYDTTLRDGAQAQGISFTVSDKIKIVKTLDELGVAYIEAGNPGSNPKDKEFFDIVGKEKLKNAKLTAFGSTRRPGIKAKDDTNIKNLESANVSVITIFGKSWDFHVTEILKTTYEENLNMIYDSIKYLADKGIEVIFDAEHYFDGYKSNAEYALKTLLVAKDAGASCLCLCDTNGGCFPNEIIEMTKIAVEKTNAVIGIHCHNDGGMAVANSIVSVFAGATQVQGTINGLGERCGNANLCTIIPNLQIKKDYYCIPKENIQMLNSVSKRISEIANVSNDEGAPYVGARAFTHKGGMHVDAIHKNPNSYEHIDPSTIGNERTIIMSEVSGRSTIMKDIHKIDPTVDRKSKATDSIIARLKELEHEGYQFEGAETSFELVIRKELGIYKSFFELGEFKVIVEEPTKSDYNSTAFIKLRVAGEDELTAAQGIGPVNALDKALRRALIRFYPELDESRLTDYKVRVLDSDKATAAKVRVLIETTDGDESWNTIGVSADIIDASWKALVDSIEYKLIKGSEKDAK